MRNSESYSDDKKLLITFDYELFLGEKSGTPQNCIIEPTTQILNVLAKYKIVKTIFFVDTIYLMRLSELNGHEAKNDYESVMDQLVDIIKKGHYIFPHIHPHWLDATYNPIIRQWSLANFDRYRFHNVTDSEREMMFDFSFKVIEEVQKKANVFFDIDGYRAGGWCIQPFKDFKPYFEKYGIKYDFSVIKDFKLNNDLFYHNFKNFPKENVYRFDDNIGQEERDGNFTEFSVTHITLTPLQKLVNLFFLKILYKLNYLNYGDGLSVHKIEENLPVNEPLMVADHKTIETTSIESLIRTKLLKYKRYSQYNNYTHFVSHPKMFTKHNIFCFDKYLEFMTKRFKVETDYKKMFK